MKPSQHQNAVADSVENGETADAPKANGTESAVDGGDTALPSEPINDLPEINVVFPTVTDVYFIIVDCTTINYVDSVGVKVLQQVSLLCLVLSVGVWGVIAG